MNENPAILEIRGVSADYYAAGGRRTRALDGIDIGLKRGGSLALVGESGSGKTTLASAIMGLIMPWEGQVSGGDILFTGSDGKTVSLIDDENVRALRGVKIALMPQDAAAALNPVMRIYPQIAEAARTGRKFPENNVEEKVREAARKAKFPSDALDAYPHQLSGGQKQRAVIAAALINSPELLIADEPTSGLDAAVAGEIIAELDRLGKTENLSLILITHDIRVAAKLCDEAAIMQRGKVCERGSLKDIIHRPRHPYTARLMSAVLSTEKIKRKTEATHERS